MPKRTCLWHGHGLRLQAVLLVSVAVVSTTAEQSPQAPSPPAGAGMVVGRAFDSDSGQGVPDVQVSITGSSRSPGGALRTFAVPPVLTDSQGRFAFTGLPDGTFFAVLQRQGYSFQVLPHTIDVVNGARVTDLNFRLTKLNTVIGTVRDDAGDPVVGTDVIAYARTAAQGRAPSLTAGPRARTDDRGEYRMTNVLAGQYVICACSRDMIPFDGQLLTTLATRPLDLMAVARRAAVAGSDAANLDSTLRTYAPTFYPNVTLASQAERLQLEKGETRTGVDITVATVRAVRVSGRLIGLPPSSISAASIRLTAVGDLPEARALTQLAPMLVQPDGRFDFASVPPGTYALDVHTAPGAGSNSPTGGALAFVGARGVPAPPPPPPPPGGRGAGPTAPEGILWATETILVGTEDVTGLIVPIQRGVSVRGKVQFVGSRPPPDPVRGVLQLSPMEPRPSRPASFGAQVNPDGTFAFALPPGRYVMPQIPSFGASWANPRSVTVKGLEVLDAPIAIDADIADMVVTIVDTPAAFLVGTTELPPDAVPEEWAVLVFPADRGIWKEPFGAVRRFFAARLQSKRNFAARVPPGQYLLAVSKGVPSDWMEASALAELSKGATEITIAEGEQKMVQIKR